MKRDVLLRAVLVVLAVASMGMRSCFENDAGADDACRDSTSCDACTPRGGCGFCAGTGVCSQGTSSGPGSGTCGDWRWLPSECSVTPPPIDSGTVRGIDSGAWPAIDSGPAVGMDSGTMTIDSGSPPGPCPGACPTGSSCDAMSGTCVTDPGACAAVTCPDTMTLTWRSGGSTQTRAACCRDYGSFANGAGCGIDRFSIGECNNAGGDSPSERDLRFSPTNTMHCDFPAGAITCPALYTGSGSSGGVTTSVYVEGCCGTSGSAVFCGAHGNCSGGPCCAPPTSGQTPVL